jgi:hypothetical protein
LTITSNAVIGDDSQTQNPNANQDELTGLAKWHADNQKQSTKVWQPLERCRKLLERLCEDPYCISFYDPVDTETYDDYLDVIETPMCLLDIQNKLDKG